MTVAATQQPPVIPPRPSKGADKETSTASVPKIPPRPASKRLERSTSPNADRFAPSPLSGGIPSKGTSSTRLGSQQGYKERSNDPIERPGSVSLPSLGEEGAEYGAVSNEVQQQNERSSSPEQTRTVSEDLKLHAPTPSLPAQTTKQRVMTVTRTDSDKAASFGIGRPGSREGLKKKPSSTFSGGSDHGHHDDEKHGIPEIGKRVPMNPYLGDVQAPSPNPDSDGSKRHHTRKHSSRSLPPGSYGLHGHGVSSQDKLEKAYYQKHPEAFERDQHTPRHDRPTDFAMSSSDLNKLVRDTANRGPGFGTSAEFPGTPTDECAFQATEEYTSRITSPRPAAEIAATDANATSDIEPSVRVEVSSPDNEKAIHVDDPKHPEFYSYGDEAGAGIEEDDYQAPILASDEVGKDPKPRLQHPAVRPHLEHRSSSYDGEHGSRPTSRPVSIHNSYAHHDFGTPTPLEDVDEYEPLFAEETKEERQKRKLADENKAGRHFPSKDIWEDAPSSVHYTTEVSTPESPPQFRRKSSTYNDKRPLTPAQAFAQHQEELAEKESRDARSREHTFLPLLEDKPTWIGRQSHLKTQKSGGSGHRFPSKDVWEDAPESQLYEAELSGSPTEENAPEIPTASNTRSAEPSERPAVPDRPKLRQGSGDDVKSKPPISEKPKPQIPARPSKSPSRELKDGQISKPKPPVPSRPGGSKIAALQAGFLTDLNKKLQLGPHAPKKEDVQPQEEENVQEKEKVPLSDARKGRARGPQRRAPAKSPSPATAVVVDSPKPALTLSFSLPQTSWAIDPEDGNIAVDEGEEKTSVTETKVEQPKPTVLEKPEPSDKLQKEAALDEAETQKHVEEPEETVNAGNAAVLEQTTQPEKTTELGEAEPAHLEDEEPRETETEASPSIVEEAKEEKKTPASNTAGETILETTVEKQDGDQVEPLEVHDAVKA